VFICCVILLLFITIVVLSIYVHSCGNDIPFNCTRSTRSNSAQLKHAHIY